MHRLARVTFYLRGLYKLQCPEMLHAFELMTVGIQATYLNILVHVGSLVTLEYDLQMAQCTATLAVARLVGRPHYARQLLEE